MQIQAPKGGQLLLLGARGGSKDYHRVLEAHRLHVVAQPVGVQSAGFRLVWARAGLWPVWARAGSGWCRAMAWAWSVEAGFVTGAMGAVGSNWA